ncbi:MAG: flippase-like domain-containing protein [Bacteroidales bacterium]|nr:flippase-like domain-containing protein [Bacteroidales bacterium]
MNLSHKTKKTIRIILVIAFYIGLYYVSKGHFEKIKDLDSNKIVISYLPLITAILLVPLNWYLESAKWKTSLLPIQKISTREAINGVLKGIPPSIFTPNRIGEAIGRPSVLNPENRISGALATAYCGLSQMPIMMFCGTISCLYFKICNINLQEANFLVSNWFIITGFTISIVVLLVYWFPKYTIPFVKKSQTSKGILSKLQFFCKYDTKQKSQIILLSLIRYIVYSTQNYLAIRAFGIDINYLEGLMSVFLIYAMMSFIPRPALAELGVRCSATVIVLKKYTEDFTSPTISSIFLWTINLLIPAIYGVTLYISEKKHKKNSEKIW